MIEKFATPATRMQQPELQIVEYDALLGEASPGMRFRMRGPRVRSTTRTLTVRSLWQSAARVLVFAACALSSSIATAQSQQQTLTSTLSFLLTNRSIQTDDFVQDELVAAATRDTISDSLLTGLTTLPIGSSAGGFTYRMEQGLGGIPQRSSATFGSFFTERSLTVGKYRGSFGVTVQHASFDTLDGQSLTDGTLVATASKHVSEPTPFDIETLTLNMTLDSLTLTSTFGLSDRVDVGVALPLLRLSLEGERMDTYRGRRLLQASASGTVSGVGDMALRVKYNLMRASGQGLAIGAEARLPTGDEENLLGSGEFSVEPRIIWSVERGRIAVDTDFGYAVGGLSGQMGYGAAVTFAAVPRFMVIGEMSGTWLESVGQLAQTTSPHPTLDGVSTIRLSAVEGSSNRLLLVGGFKWNPATTWLVSGNLLRRTTTDGLTASWVPSFAVEYAFGR